MAKTNSKPNIYDFTDYTDYLRSIFDYLKKSNPNFSFKFFALKAGFSSRSYMQFVVKGERALSLKGIPKVCKGLELNKKESQYLESLVLFKESKDHSQKIRYWEQIQKLGKSSNVIKLQGMEFDYFKHWFIAPIREIVSNVNFKEDYAALGRMLVPAVSSKQAKFAVDLLKQLKLIKKKGNKYITADPHLKGSPLVRSLAIRKFQKEHINLSVNSHERFPKEERDVSTMTISTTEKGFEEIKKQVAEFQENIIGIIEKYEDADRVYQLNFQFFPLSHKFSENR